MQKTNFAGQELFPFLDLAMLFPIQNWDNIQTKNPSEFQKRQTLPPSSPSLGQSAVLSSYSSRGKQANFSFASNLVNIWWGKLRQAIPPSPLVPSALYLPLSRPWHSGIFLSFYWCIVSLYIFQCSSSKREIYKVQG